MRPLVREITKTLRIERSKASPSRGLRKLEIALALFALSFYALCIASAAAWADSRDVAAIAPLSPLRPESHNGDYLREPEGAQDPNKTLNKAIFDKAVADEMTQKFSSFSVPYQIKQSYQLSDQSDYLRYEKSNKDLAEWTIKKLLQYHFEHTFKDNLESAVKRAASEPAAKNSNDGGERAAAKAAVAIANVRKALQDSTLNLGKDTKTRFKYDFPSGVMRVGMTSPVVETTMDYRLKPVDPSAAIGTVSQPEKLSVGMNKNIEFARASTGVRYGLLSETLNYGLNKHVYGPLSAQVDQAHNIKDTSKDETLFRINIGASF